MKIIEKKCPNCGASLSFNTTDKEIKCSYCKQEYTIENDNKEESKKVNSENFTLHKKVIAAIGIAQLIPAVIFFIIIIGVAYFIFTNAHSQMEEMKDRENQLESTKVSINQIDDYTLSMIHSSSSETLKTWNHSLKSFTKGEYENIGFYLYDDGFSTRLSDVYKTTYTNNESGEKIDIYTSVSYHNVEYVDNHVSLNYIGFINMHTVNLGDSSFDEVHGYRSLEELYTKEIRSNRKGKIEATEGLYQQ